MKISEYTIHGYLDALAGKQATPGGGSAAALMGAQAAALVSMVCHLTIGKTKYAAAEPEMRTLLAESEALRAELTIMIQDDVDVFNRLMRCYALPKSSEAEKAARAEQLQAALKDATLAPLACANACAKALQLSGKAAELGYAGVISDAGVAALSGYGGLKSAALNVRINAVALHDRAFADACLLELQALTANAEEEVAMIFQSVKTKL